MVKCLKNRINFPLDEPLLVMQKSYWAFPLKVSKSLEGDTTKCDLMQETTMKTRSYGGSLHTPWCPHLIVKGQCPKGSGFLMKEVLPKKSWTKGVGPTSLQYLYISRTLIFGFRVPFWVSVWSYEEIMKVGPMVRATLAWRQRRSRLLSVPTNVGPSAADAPAPKQQAPELSIKMSGYRRWESVVVSEMESLQVRGPQCPKYYNCWI